MRRHRSILAAAFCCSLAFPAAAADSTRPSLDAVQVRLFYATTGVLSDNIAPPAKFAAWNTTIGEGDARQPADDLLVTAHLSVKGDEANSSTPLTIKVSGKNGRVLAQRSFKSLFFKGGHSVQALYLPDAACAGQLQIEAVFGTQKKAVALNMACGE